MLPGSVTCLLYEPVEPSFESYYEGKRAQAKRDTQAVFGPCPTTCHALWAMLCDHRLYPRTTVLTPSRRLTNRD